MCQGERLKLSLISSYMCINHNDMLCMHNYLLQVEIGVENLMEKDVAMGTILQEEVISRFKQVLRICVELLIFRGKLCNVLSLNLNRT